MTYELSQQVELLLSALGSLVHVTESILSFHTRLLTLNRGDRIRTCDPLVPNQVLHQTEPHLVNYLTEIGGFEPSRRLHGLLVFKTSPFNHLGISPKLNHLIQCYLLLHFCILLHNRVQFSL